MTVAVAWVRTIADCEELIFCSDSRLSGNARVVDVCQKVITLRGNDFSALVTFENNHSIEYESWVAFQNGNWQSPDITQCLVLKWNFLVQFPECEKPEHHSVVVRFTNSLRPLQFLQAALSKDPDDVDRLETDAMPMICRIDFADSLLAKEILAIASEWNEGRRKPYSTFPVMDMLKKRSDNFETLVAMSVLWFSVSTYFFWFIFTQISAQSATTVTVAHLRSLLWFSLGLLLVYGIARTLGKWLGRMINKHIQRFGRFTIFELTHGDANRQTDLQAKSQNSIYKFAGASVFALTWNIVSSVLMIMWSKLP